MKTKVNFQIWLLVSVFLAVAAGPATGKTIYVNPGGSIQAAIDDPTTLNGDVIEVAPGTYNEAINFNGKAVRLYSIGGPEVTTIDGTGNYHVVQCVSGEGANTILEGFTITGGNANGPEWPNDKNGGGMYCLFSSPTVVGCRFSGNTGEYGGGLASRNSGPTVTNCTFTGNSGEEGGGLYNILSPITVTNCIFTGNSAGHGGGINNDSTQAVVTNCLFSANTSTFGGGMYNLGGTPTVTNCTFTGNSAPYGGGIDNYNSNPIVTNCILWGNTPDAIRDDGSSSTTATYSDVQGGWPGTGNIDADPCFVDPAGGDLRLISSVSPCVDTGANGAPGLPATDLAGNPRIVDGDRDGTSTVDMGAYELQAWEVHNITQDRWYDIIQVSIDDANDGDEIEVAPGAYNEAINFNGKAIRLYSSGGPEVTTIDGTGAYHVVQCVSGEGANTILEGFTITGGNANGAGNDSYGGGMYNNGSSPTVTNCTFNGNSASEGGGMFNSSSSPTVTDCNFTDNTAAYYGGGMDNYISNPTLTNCEFLNNTASWNGGGMHNSNSSPTVIDCNFNDNTAAYSGGGMNNYISNPTLTNCNFLNNTASWDGGGMHNSNSSPTVTNCTFSNNNTARGGGGICNALNSNPNVTNCTFSGNSADYGGGMYSNQSSPRVTNCTFADNEAGIYGGGGIYNALNSNPNVTNCTFSGNEAGTYGGGMRNYESSPTLTNCILSNNTANWGGGMDNYYSSPTLTNCTFSGNEAGTNGGGMFNKESSSPTGINCILWGNIPEQIVDHDSPASTTVVVLSDVQGGWVGTGNIDVDPCFVDANNPDPNLWNLRLKPDSPCIDAGNSTPLLDASIMQDLDGMMRFVDIIAVVDTGVGLFTFTDMGAYEFNCNYTHGDINCDGAVNFKDMAILAANWLAGTEP